MIIDLRQVQQRIFQPGDKIKRPYAFGLDHVGVYVGPIGANGEDVIHNDKESGRVVLTDFAYFAQGQPVTLDARWARTEDERQLIVNRAVALIGYSYNLENFNCEHPADIAVFGQPIAAQTGLVKFLVGIAAVGGVIWAANRE